MTDFEIANECVAGHSFEDYLHALRMFNIKRDKIYHDYCDACFNKRECNITNKKLIVGCAFHTCE